VKLSYTGISKEMLTPDIVGRKVFRRATSSDLVDDDPQLGRVVAYTNQDGRLYVVWEPGQPPTPFRVTELMLVKEEMRLTKTMKWSGKTLGSLEKFVEQVQVEGGDYDTVLNPGKHEHVAIVVELPLATDTSSIQAKLPSPRHDHEFTEPCVSRCPAYGYHPDMEDGR